MKRWRISISWKRSIMWRNIFMASPRKSRSCWISWKTGTIPTWNGWTRRMTKKNNSDLLAIIPSYLSVVFVGAQSLLVLRALRLLRIFRIFRLVHFLSEMRFLSTAIANSLRKISIFILFVLTCVVILGSVIYLVED